MKKSENRKKNSKAVKIAIIVFLFIALCAVIYFFVPADNEDASAKETITASEDITQNEADTVYYDFPEDPDIANKAISQKDGYSESFYRPGEGMNVSVDYRLGKMDLTEMVKDWCFGEPMIDLRAFAENMGYTLQKKTPKNFKHTDPYLEVFEEGDEPDLEKFIMWYLVTDDRAYRYVSGSSIVYDSEGNCVQAPAAVKKLDDKDILVPAELLPIYNAKSGEKYYASYEYSENEIGIKLNNIEQETLEAETFEEEIEGTEEETKVNDTVDGMQEGDSNDVPTETDENN